MITKKQFLIALLNCKKDYFWVGDNCPIRMQRLTKEIAANEKLTIYEGEIGNWFLDGYPTGVPKHFKVILEENSVEELSAALKAFKFDVFSFLRRVTPCNYIDHYKWFPKRRKEVEDFYLETVALGRCSWQIDSE
jgi:hypothetical protein